MSRAALLLACSTILMSCVITRDLDYQPPPNYPASVHGTTETPMDQIRIVDRGVVGIGDAGAAENVEFSAIVRDPNLDQQLIGLVFVDYRPDDDNQPVIPEIPIPPNPGDDPLNRRVTFSLSALGDFGTEPGCHTVQLHVSREFVQLNDPRPADETDLGIGTWFVSVVDDEMPTLVGCETY